MANTLFYNTGKLFAKHFMPCLLDCNMVVDVANGNGLGQRSLKGPGIAQVFLHTTFGSPAVFNGITNNVAAGFAQVFFNDNYNKYFGGFSGFVSQLSGANVSISAGLTKGAAYVITSVGTSTAANWQAVGLSVGITPAAGVAFIASTAVAGVGTGVVQLANANGSGIGAIDVIGDPNLTLSPVGIGAGNPYIIVRMLAQNAPPVAAQPADSSVLGLAFYLSNSSVTVAGE